MNDGIYQNDIDTVPRLTQYNFENIFKIYETDGIYEYNLANTIFFPDELDVNTYVSYQIPGRGMSWNYISYIHYGTIKLWWLVCALNKVDNPMIFPEPGSVIKILKPAVLRDVLQQIQQTK